MKKYRLSIKAIGIADKYRYLFYLGLFLAVCIGTACFRIPQNAAIKIIYAQYTDPTTTAGAYYNIGEGFPLDPDIQIPMRSDTLCPQELEIPIIYDCSQIEDVQIVLNCESGVQQIRSMELTNHGIQIYKFSPEEIMELFRILPDNLYRYEAPYITLDLTESIIMLWSKEEFVQKLQGMKGQQQSMKVNLIFYMICAMAVAEICWRKRKNIYQAIIRVKNYYLSESYLVLLKKATPVFMTAVWIGVALTALKSLHYAHPDEQVTKVAIDYYLGKWIPPDVRSSWVAGTYSEMGSTRLDEMTYYYFAAGKLGGLVKLLTPFTTYYRMLNVLLLGIMIVMTIKVKEKCPWMLIAVGINPQLWALFSYATSDAWDYFWSFIILYQLTKEDSLFNQYIQKKSRRPVAALIFAGVMFAFIFQAKKNYYVILLFAFLVLFVRMLRNRKEWKGIIFRYLKVVLMTLIICSGRYLIDIWHYGAGGLKNVAGEAFKQHASAIYKNGPVNTTGMKALGYSLQDVLDKGLFRELYSTFVGNYGRLEFPSGIGYEYLYGVMGLAVILILCVFIMKNKDFYKVLETAGIFVLCAMMVGVVVWHCWTGDYQPQGRYLLMCFVMLGYLGSIAKRKMWDNPVFLTVVNSMTVISVYSYVWYGMTRLLIFTD